MSVIKNAGVRAPLPPFVEEHEKLRESVRRFVSAEIAPHVDEWEEAREFPRELFRRCGELGFLGLKFPERYGGQGGDPVHDAVWIEELSRAGGPGGDRGAAGCGRIGWGRREPQGPRADRDAARVQLRHRGSAATLDRAGNSR